ncbi:hypothetical protein F4083_03990 [Candidatus Poribacteria bacterium]|nr:hypothetical protein [Candidatus Poribacteria bacterium]
MLKKHFRIIIGSLLIVFILSSVGIYLYFSSKASDIEEKTCDEFIDPIYLSNLSPEYREKTGQQETAKRPGITEDTDGFSITGVDGLTFYYTRPLTEKEQERFDIHTSSPHNPHKRTELLKMSIISHNQIYRSEETFEGIMKDLVALRITAAQAERRLMDFYQAKYTDKPIDPIIAITSEHSRSDAMLYVLDAYQQYLYWHNVTRYHGCSLFALEIASATLQVEWQKNKQRMCKAALSLAEDAGFSLYKRLTDGSALRDYLPLLEKRVKQTAARLATNYESREALAKGRSDIKHQMDEKKALLKQLFKNLDAAYSHYVVHTEAYNNRSTSKADTVTVIKKRSLPKLLLDTVMPLNTTQ